MKPDSETFFFHEECCHLSIESEKKQNWNKIDFNIMCFGSHLLPDYGVFRGHFQVVAGVKGGIVLNIDFPETLMLSHLMARLYIFYCLTFTFNRRGLTLLSVQKKNLKSTKVQLKTVPYVCDLRNMQDCETHLSLISIIDEACPHSGRPALQLPLLAAVEVVAVVAVTPRHGTLKTCPDNHIHCVRIIIDVIIWQRPPLLLSFH